MGKNRWPSWMLDWITADQLSLAVLGAAVHARRTELGWSREEFADRAGVSVHKIDEWESGEYDFLLSEIFVLERVLGE